MTKTYKDGELKVTFKAGIQDFEAKSSARI